METKIEKLGDEDSDLTSSDSKYRSGNNHFQFCNKRTSFTGNNKFKTDHEDYVNIPGVNNPKGVVIQQAF